MPCDVVGWDIGGAHLKAARVDELGRLTAVAQVPCPLWRGMAELDRAWEGLRARIGDATVHAVTMTGESADVFPDRAAGVAAICDWAMTRLATGALRVYDRQHGLTDAACAAKRPAQVASANWAATAAWVAHCVPDAIVIDVGSTTSDLVPVVDGACRACGANDHERLAARELVYAGVVRTPVVALADAVEMDGRCVPLCAELFATAADVYRLLGRLAPEHDQADTADGRGRSRCESAARLARMVGLDLQDPGIAAMEAVAQQLAARQAGRLAQAWLAVTERRPQLRKAPIVALGAGAFLAVDLAARVGVPLVPFASLVPRVPGDDLARDAVLAGPAVALALLAHAALPAREVPPCGW
jgi:probable H4MPT-linked C1 transfer pathway protein